MAGDSDRGLCTAGCNLEFLRRTIRRHLHNGCPGSTRREQLHREATALADHARLRTPSSPRGGQHNDSPLALPPLSLQRCAKAQKRVAPPTSDVEAERQRADLDFDARNRHLDFGYDTAGAGPSSRSPSPLLPPQACREPVPPEIMASWLGDMSPEDYLSQQLHGELAREGGK